MAKRANGEDSIVYRENKKCWGAQFNLTCTLRTSSDLFNGLT